MKKTSSFQTIKPLLVAGLLAATSLAFNAMAQETDFHWSPFNVFDDGNGPYAYFSDDANWDQAVTPGYTNSAGLYIRVMDNQSVGSHVVCVITNDMNLYQLMIGAGGSGDVVITNGAHVTAGVGMFGGPNQWTGVGFPDGPSTLTIIGAGSSLTCGDHLWVGQGLSHGSPDSVIVDGGTLTINGQLGLSWNGTGGTNTLTITNGGTVNLNQWANQTLGHNGANGNPSNLGILNIAKNNCSVIINGNVTGFFPSLIASNQLIAYGGLGTIQYSYNPVGNKTTISAIAPGSPIITAQPTNVITSLGATASFTVANNNVPVNYQWLFNGNPVSNGGGISGATTATITITGITLAQLGSYSVKVTAQSDSSLFTTSSSATLSTQGINLYPVVTINGVPGSTYVSQYATTLSGPWTSFATNTANSFAPIYVVDSTSPMSVTKFYRALQQ